jgi:hypothetical protein
MFEFGPWAIVGRAVILLLLLLVLRSVLGVARALQGRRDMCNLCTSNYDGGCGGPGVVTRKGSPSIWPDWRLHTLCTPPTCRRSTHHSPPIRTKLPCIVSRMATQRDLEYNQIFLNACVLLDSLRIMTVLIVTHYSSPGPSTSQNAGRGFVNPFFCVYILVKNNHGTALKSPNRTEDYPLNYPRNALRSR